MTECDTETKNAMVEIRSKCYCSSPQDRYRIIYSYPLSEFGPLVASITGDTLFFSTGEGSFLSDTPSDDFKNVQILLDNGDRITAEYSTNTGKLTVKYLPQSGPETIMQVGHTIWPPTLPIVSPPLVSSFIGSVTYSLGFTVDQSSIPTPPIPVGEAPILTIQVNDTMTTVTLQVNMNTQVITVS